MPKSKNPPHVEDAEMDILNVTGLEPKRDVVLRRHSNGAETVKPLSWKEMGFDIKPTKQARQRLA